MTTSLIASLADRPRDAEASCGPRRPGYLSEFELAARWGRASNTLASWRNRPPAAHDPVPCELFGIYAYYPIVSVWAYEQDPRHARVRPMALRDEPFPPLFTARLEEYSAESLAVMAQLALSTMEFRDAVLAAKWAAVDFVPTHACREEVRAFNAIHLSAPQTVRETADVEAQPELPLEGAHDRGESWDSAAAQQVKERRSLARLQNDTTAAEEAIDALAAMAQQVKERRSLARLQNDTTAAEEAIDALAAMHRPTIMTFEIKAGYAIARDDFDRFWFAEVIGGLGALHWQPVAPLPLPHPTTRVPATAEATQ
jgi:hypothetical protein